jgi:cardiolipin synthase
MLTWSYTFWLFGILYPFLVGFIILVIMLENRDPVKTIAWLLVLVLLPLLGVILYFFFGRNFRKIRTFNRKAAADQLQIKNLRGVHFLDLKAKNFFNDEKIRQKSPIITLLMNNSKALLTEGNHVDILNNGTETFPAMMEALKQAQDHIHIAFYIISDDKIGNTIRKILEERAQAGVDVRVIYDGVGSWMLSSRYVSALRQAGVMVYPFRPVNFPFLTSKLNYRNHRKIVVVDGKVGFIGGLNIGDKYLDGDPELGFWRDVHLKLEGDAVKSLQTVFLTDWYFVARQELDSDRFFPTYRVPEHKLVQIIASGPDSEWANIMQAYFAAITSAQEHIYISTPYFTPNRSIMTALKTAALSGIDVRLILPGNSDARINLWSSYSYLEELLAAGVRTYIYQDGFTHGKMMMVDGVFASVGSANMDIRSFDQNLEINALIYNRETAQALEQAFWGDLQSCCELDLYQFRQRPISHKLRESTARVFSPLL